MTISSSDLVAAGGDCSTCHACHSCHARWGGLFLGTVPTMGGVRQVLQEPTAATFSITPCQTNTKVGVCGHSWTQLKGIFQKIPITHTHTGIFRKTRFNCVQPCPGYRLGKVCPSGRAPIKASGRTGGWGAKVTRPFGQDVYQGFWQDGGVRRVLQEPPAATFSLTPGQGRCCGAPTAVVLQISRRGWVPHQGFLDGWWGGQKDAPSGQGAAGTDVRT